MAKIQGQLPRKKKECKHFGMQDHAQSIALATSQCLLEQNQRLKESNLALSALKSSVQNILSPQKAEK